MCFRCGPKRKENFQKPQTTFSPMYHCLKYSHVISLWDYRWCVRTEIRVMLFLHTGNVDIQKTASRLCHYWKETMRNEFNSKPYLFSITPLLFSSGQRKGICQSPKLLKCRAVQKKKQLNIVGHTWCVVRYSGHDLRKVGRCYWEAWMPREEAYNTLYPKVSGSHCGFLRRGGTSTSQMVAEDPKDMTEQSSVQGACL